MIKIDYLKHFVAAAETGSFSTAASKVSISPTSIRHSIEKLEVGLNTTLFIRRPSEGVSLTEDGHQLLKRTRHLINDVEDISGLFLTKDRKLRGDLVIGSQEALTWSLIPRAIEKMSELHPELNMSVKTVWMETVFEKVESADVDILLTFTTLKNIPSKYTVVDLCSPQTCAMMRKGHPLDTGKPVALKDLAKYPQIFIQDGPAWPLFYGMYRDRGLDPEIYMESNISTGAQAAVGRTDAISLRIVRPANPQTPLGDPMVVPMVKDKVNQPRLIAVTNRIKRPLLLDKRVIFTEICQQLFDNGDMKSHIYY